MEGNTSNGTENKMEQEKEEKKGFKETITEKIDKAPKPVKYACTFLGGALAMWAIVKLVGSSEPSGVELAIPDPQDVIDVVPIVTDVVEDVVDEPIETGEF